MNEETKATLLNRKKELERMIGAAQEIREVYQEKLSAVELDLTQMHTALVQLDEDLDINSVGAVVTPKGEQTDV